MDDFFFLPIMDRKPTLHPSPFTLHPSPFTLHSLFILLFPYTINNKKKKEEEEIRPPTVFQRPTTRLLKKRYANFSSIWISGRNL